MTNTKEYNPEKPWNMQTAGRVCYLTRWKHQKDGDRSLSNYEKTIESSESITPTTPAVLVNTASLSMLACELTDLGLGPATVNRRLYGIRAVLGVAYDAEEIEKIPRYKKMREGSGRTRVITSNEFDLLQHHLENTGRHHIMHLILFLFRTGCRVGEALKIEWRDVDLKNGSVLLRDTKSGKDRHVYYNGMSLSSLRKYSADAPGPFASITTSAFSRAWVDAKNSIGLGADDEFVPHAIRHTFATDAVRSGTPLHIVSRLLGHSSLQMTMRYAHAADEDLRAAVEKLHPQQQQEDKSV